MANKIQIRRGQKANLPSLDIGEPALCTDTKEVFIGNSGGNVELVNKETLANHLGDYTLQIPYGIAGGSVNAYTVTLNPALTSYVEGVAVAVKINANNTGAATININDLGAKAIVDSKGNALSAGKLLANSIYTMRYNGTNFILQGEGASGNALASDLLSGKTATTDAGDITGTMPNRAGDNESLASSVSGTSLKLKAPQGYYDGVDDFVTISDANFIADNIKSGINLFGIIGTLPPKPPDDYKGSPGSQYLTHGDMTTGGYFGRYTGICTGAALATAAGVSAGLVLNYSSVNVDWCKIAFENKILFVAQKPLRYRLSWNNLNTAGCATGEKQIIFNGITYSCRLIKQDVTNGELRYVMKNLNNQGEKWDNLTNTDLHFNQGSGVNGSSCFGYENSGDYARTYSSYSLFSDVYKTDSTNINLGWRPVLEVV